MLTSGKEGYLYERTRTDLLSAYICALFEKDAMAQELGSAARRHALFTHNAQSNFKRLMEIYHEINLCVELHKSSSNSDLECSL